jgi:hypothetical protein
MARHFFPNSQRLPFSAAAAMTEIDPAQIGGTSRFYEKEFPDLEECVMVNVKSIAEMGAYVQVRE